MGPAGRARPRSPPASHQHLTPDWEHHNVHVSSVHLNIFRTIFIRDHTSPKVREIEFSHQSSHIFCGIRISSVCIFLSRTKGGSWCISRHGGLADTNPEAEEEVAPGGRGGRADREGAGRDHHRVQELRDRAEGGHHTAQGCLLHTNFVLRIIIGNLSTYCQGLSLC